MRVAQCVVTFLAGLLFTASAWAADPYAGIDPYWVLLHEPSVQGELKLTAAQQKTYHQLLDELDLQFFPLRNQPAQQGREGLAKIIATCQTKLKTLLKADQSQRLTEIQLWQLGTSALLREEVAMRLRCDDKQRASIKQIIDDSRTSVASLEKELNAGAARDTIQTKYRAVKDDEQKQIWDLLKPEQRTAWREILGEKFDVATLGQPAFKAPELIDTKQWVNSPPLRLDRLRGQVVVVHFYASGCINCIRNYPWYRQWHEKFQDQEVVLIGIHTPETDAERDLAGVRSKAAAEKFAFPILLDVKSENWNAWGNNMWPSVYLIDKRGRVRNFWPGELNWQGNEGEKFMRERIEALVKETL